MDRVHNTCKHGHLAILAATEATAERIKSVGNSKELFLKTAFAASEQLA
jgi:hypothetical protein